MGLNRIAANDENELIAKIKNEQDDAALAKLFRQYSPLVGAVWFRNCLYKLGGYERTDWYQEALIICYKAAMGYTESKSHFSYYFKFLLTNRAITLIRYYKADRRCLTTTYAVSLEFLLEEEDSDEDADCIGVIETILDIPFSELSRELVKKLNRVEKAVLLMQLGLIEEQELFEEYKLEQEQICKARFTVKRKITKLLF